MQCSIVIGIVFAALVPHPRLNLTRYHGVFAPSPPMRGAIVLTPAPWESLVGKAYLRRSYAVSELSRSPLTTASASRIAFLSSRSF